MSEFKPITQPKLVDDDPSRTSEIISAHIPDSVFAQSEAIEATTATSQFDLGVNLNQPQLNL